MHRLIHSKTLPPLVSLYPVVLVWYYPLTMNSTSRQTWVMWCCSSSVSTERLRLWDSVSWRCRKRTSVTFCICLTDMQSLLPSSFESAGHVFLAPRWPPSPSSLSWSLFLCLLILILFSVSPENTASVCIFLTTTPSFCRTSSRSCSTFLQNRMSVSVWTATAYNIYHCLQTHRWDNILVLCLRWPRPHPQLDFGF